MQHVTTHRTAQPYLPQLANFESPFIRTDLSSTNSTYFLLCFLACHRFWPFAALFTFMSQPVYICSFLFCYIIYMQRTCTNIPATFICPYYIKHSKDFNYDNIKPKLKWFCFTYTECRNQQATSLPICQMTHSIHSRHLSFFCTHTRTHGHTHTNRKQSIPFIHSNPYHRSAVFFFVDIRSYKELL